LTKRYKLRIPRDLYEAMLAHALAETPNECCGLLAGLVSGDVALVSRHLPLVNIASTPQVEYLSEPGSMFAAEKAMRAEQIERLAVYHSHPASDPIPSRKDRERNFDGAALNLIISLKERQPLVRAWWLINSDAFEGEWEIVGCTDVSEC
jgi:proteasome lid subunit RPN8/RPN11